MITILFGLIGAVGQTVPICEDLVPRWDIAAANDVDLVWSGHPVGFYLLTAPPYQYVAYYDRERTLVVAAKRLGEERWQYKRLPTSVGWDSHNGIVMAVDRTGCLHVSGNMHVNPLIYFRMTEPHNLESLVPVHRMLGQEENRVTYPRFVTTPEGGLIFFYRDGASGRGRQLFNIYDAGSRSWRRLLDKPLLDGGEEMSAYPSGPVFGPDGRWHLCWMWRDTPDCSTNHDISYARSPDLIHWETAAGAPISLPITPATKGVVVDPAPAKQGLINVGHHVGFDAKHRPIVTYHKYDSNGNSQIFNARWEQDRWVVYQTSDWDYRWEFSGGGSIGVEISAGQVHLAPSGVLVQKFSHSRYGGGIWVLNEDTLRPEKTCRSVSELPRTILQVESDFPGMQVRIAWDNGRPPDGESFLLRWETLPPNRDRPRSGPLPPPTPLRLYHLRQVNSRR